MPVLLRQPLSSIVGATPQPLLQKALEQSDAFYTDAPYCNGKKDPEEKSLNMPLHWAIAQRTLRFFSAIAVLYQIMAKAAPPANEESSGAGLPGIATSMIAVRRRKGKGRETVEEKL